MTVADHIKDELQRLRLRESLYREQGRIADSPLRLSEGITILELMESLAKKVNLE